MATVSIKQGKLKGSVTKTEHGFEFYEFMGVPYAKPPVGDLRFKTPVSPEPWEGERDATTIDENNICCQFDFTIGKMKGSEDCLYLNVYTPTLLVVDSKPLPVMVYIHGGGFVRGSGITKNEGGPDFLLEHNVVVVTMNYRLSVFGFLSLGIPEAAGNMGLKDQVKALEWIQNNISEFGGDKNNVTLCGASAGSGAAEHLMISPLAKGLFHKAILQSGSSLNHWAVNYEPEPLVLQLLDQLEYKGSTNDKCAIHDFLNKVDTSTLASAASQAQEKLNLKRICFGFVPTIEKDFGSGDEFLVTSPYKMFKEGKFSQVPVIKGYCNEEGHLTKFLKPNSFKDIIEGKNFLDYLAFNFNDEDIKRYTEKFSNLYTKHVEVDDEPDKIAVDFFTDLDFAAGIWIAAKMLAKNGVPVYCYKFSYDGKANLVKKMFNVSSKGATHCDDVTYVLTNETVKLEDEKDILMKNRLTTLLTNFAKTGNPTPELNNLIPVRWPAYTEETKGYLSVDKELTIERNYEAEKMALFEEIYEKYEK